MGALKMKNQTKSPNRLLISSADVALLQLEWSYVEQPSALPRFRNFPFVDRDAVQPEPAPAHARRPQSLAA
jgi:hypothetical protein